LFDRLGQYHRRLGEQYGAAADARADDRVGVLLQFLADREEALERALAEYTQTVDQPALERIVRYPPEENPPGEDGAEAGREDKAADLIGRAVQYHRRAASWCRLLKGEGGEPELEEVFGEAARLEEQEAARIARDAMSFGDTEALSEE
jgi:hypothetical protein